MLAKTIVGAAWLFGIGSFFVAPGSAAAGAGRGLLVFLVVAHLIECAVFLPRLRSAGGSLVNHLVQTFLFGMFHVRELPAADAAGKR